MSKIARVKYDVSNVEARNFSTPKPGVYDATIHEMSFGKSSRDNDMLTIVFEITRGDFKGSRVWYYILTDGSQEWRMREFTDACGLKPKGTIDTEALAGTDVKIKTAVDPATEEFDEKAKIKNVLPAGESSGGKESDDDDDEAPYEEWELADLKEEVEARDLTIEGKKTKKKLADALNADDAEGDDEDEEDEEEEDEEDEEGDDEITRKDLDKMSRTELKKLIAEEELELKILKKDTEESLRDKIAEALELEDEEDESEEEEEEEEDEESEEEDTDYEEWDVTDLKAELKERGLKTDGRKSVLVKRLQKDDESSDEPF